jgi:hypothetical protein
MIISIISWMLAAMFAEERETREREEVKGEEVSVGHLIGLT